MTVRPDDGDRTRALTELGSTFLVEAAAGTGKTSLLAGRLTMLLADGVHPRNIAAITFTELAAGELRVRVTRFVSDLLKGVVPQDLALALPEGPTPSQKGALERGWSFIDELTATTIHGFCHSLLRSYAIESGIDPGAEVLEAVQTDLLFRSVFERWMRRRLGENARPDDPVAVMAKRDPAEAVDTLKKLGKFRREFPSARPLPSDLDDQADVPLVDDVRQFRRWFDLTPKPEKAEGDLIGLEQLASFYEGAFSPLPSFEKLWDLAHPKRIDAMLRRSYDLRPYRRLGIWKGAAGKVDGQRLSEEAGVHYARCSDSFRTLLGRIATSLVAAFSSEIDDLLSDFDREKSNAAVLDFDDLLRAARRLLQTHEEVRQAISNRYTRILVDEFQDTDPVQAEILFLIASEAGAGRSWRERKLIPGQLFMVGDPKQAIYRFRGADVASYVEARDAVGLQFPGNILQVTSNFRSREPILNHVNQCFAERLGRRASGYVPLHATLGEAEHGLPCVMKVTVQVAPQSRIDSVREEEARTVADVCARLIGNLRIRRSNGRTGPLVPGDIALLAPAGTDLWRYERALEENGLPLVSQAGRSLFRRQETQDLVAIVRTLADGRDTLAFGSLMRGPCVGLTEQELLDIVEALPPAEATLESGPRLSLQTEPRLVNHPVAREVLTILRDLRRRARSTTPFLLISEALDRLLVRPALAARSGDQAPRALANLDLLMERARAYSVRGLVQLARDLQSDWEGPEPHDEARIDASGEAVEIVTVHSSKGLEWPVVIPINTASEFRRRDPFIYRRADDTMHWVLRDVVPPAIADAISADDQQNAEERERLLYVACTRAIDLLILPQLSYSAQNSWAQLLDLKQGDLQELDVSHFPLHPVLRLEIPTNDQSAEKFSAEKSQVDAASTKLQWRRPSEADFDRQLLDSFYDEVEQVDIEIAAIAGGAARGLALHKLMEELLTGEVADAPSAVEARARELLDQLGHPATGGPDPGEIATTALRTLALPAIAECRGRLVPEVPIYASGEDGMVLVTGRADALAEGGPAFVVDWKSDVAPTDTERAAHKAQLLAYLSATGPARGAIVYMSLGQINWLEAP